MNYIHCHYSNHCIGIIHYPLPTLANFVGSVLSHSLNRVYLVRALPSPKFLASLGTSDILKTLDEMLFLL